MCPAPKFSLQNHRTGSSLLLYWCRRDARPSNIDSSTWWRCSPAKASESLLMQPARRACPPTSIATTLAGDCEAECTSLTMLTSEIASKVAIATSIPIYSGSPGMWVCFIHLYYDISLCHNKFLELLIRWIFLHSELQVFSSRLNLQAFSKKPVFLRRNLRVFLNTVFYFNF